MQNLNVSQAEKIQALRANRYFSALPEAALADLSRGVTLRSYTRGEVVCWQGEVCRGLYVIRSGSVKLFKLSPKGRELIIKVFEAGATFNEVPVFDHGVNPCC